MGNFFRKLLVGLFACILVLFIFGVGVLTGSVFGDSTISSTSNSGRFDTFERVYNIMANTFYFGEDSEQFRQQLVIDAINGMVDAQGDIHTEYMSAQELSQFTGSLESSFVGIGVTYTALDDNLLVKSTIKGSPAEAAGILSGDLIVAVDHVRLTAENVDNVQDMIKGQKGTDVVITVIRGNKEFDVTITRDEISNTVFSEYLGDGIGLLELTSFSDGTGKEVGRHLKDLVDDGTKRLIIDLRDNGGGYAFTLDEICTYFMNKGDIIMREVDRNGKETIDTCKAGTKYEFEKIIIITNENSASCSEVFTLAMRENVGAIIVGETTYGKGIAQLTKMFADGSALKYTDQAWMSASGEYVGNKGITPDYKVRLPEVLYQAYLKLEEDELIKVDTVNEKTVNIQMMLDFLDYEVDRFDGYYSAKTETAVRAFQKDAGLAVTGSVDNETAKLLNSEVVLKWQMHKDVIDSQMNKALELARQ